MPRAPRRAAPKGATSKGEPPPFAPATVRVAVEFCGVSLCLDEVPWDERVAAVAALLAVREAALKAYPDLRPTLDTVHGGTPTVVPDEYEGGRRRMGF